MLLSTSYLSVQRWDVSQVLICFTQMHMDYLVYALGEFKRKQWFQEKEATDTVI